MRIIHIITSLGDGGAENILHKICRYDLDNQHIIISLKQPDKYSRILKKLGIKVYYLNLKFYSIFKFFYLIKLLKYLKPDLIQTWLIHGDLIGGLAAKFSNIKNIFWNVRYSKLEFEKDNLINIFLIRILAIFSYIIPKKIIVVSKSAKKNCLDLGYSKKKLILISNGYDLSLFKCNLEKRISFRKKLNLSKNIFVIGNVARFAKMKDHFTLIKALSLIQLKNIRFLCILIGSGVDKSNLELLNKIKKLKLTKNIKLLGKNDDIPQVMNGIDIYIQSSKYGEGFPNVVAEAMACKVPCIVTNSGDAPLIVGRTGWVIPPNNPKKLAKAIMSAISKKNTKKWVEMRKSSRERIKKNFHIDRMIMNYKKIWSTADV